MSYYHSNPAVIKSQLSQLPQQAFIQQALIIRSTLFQLPFSSSSKSHYQRFLNLYICCRVFYRGRFLQTARNGKEKKRYGKA